MKTKMETEKETKAETYYQISTESMLNLSLEVLKFYYESMQKRMNDYHQQARDTTERGYKVISIYATLLIALCTYLYTNWELTAVGFALLSLLIGTAISTTCMLKVLLPRDYMPLGRSAEELNPNGYASSFGDETSSNMQMKCILRDEINKLEDRIQWQGKRNIHRTRLFSFSLKSIMTSILVSAIICLCSLLP